MRTKNEKRYISTQWKNYPIEVPIPYAYSFFSKLKLISFNRPVFLR